jgi:hypothetical protein
MGILGGEYASTTENEAGAAAELEAISWPFLSQAA